MNFFEDVPLIFLLHYIYYLVYSFNDVKIGNK